MSSAASNELVMPSPRRSHAADRVLDDQARRGRKGQPAARLEKDVRRRFLVHDLVAVHDRLKQALRQSDLAEVRQHFDPVRA